MYIEINSLKLSRSKFYFTITFIFAFNAVSTKEDVRNKIRYLFPLGFVLITCSHLYKLKRFYYYALYTSMPIIGHFVTLKDKALNV